MIRYSAPDHKGLSMSVRFWSLHWLHETISNQAHQNKFLPPSGQWLDWNRTIMAHSESPKLKDELHFIGISSPVNSYVFCRGLRLQVTKYNYLFISSQPWTIWNHPNLFIMIRKLLLRWRMHKVIIHEFTRRHWSNNFKITLGDSIEERIYILDIRDNFRFLDRSWSMVNIAALVGSHIHFRFVVTSIRTAISCFLYCCGKSLFGAENIWSVL